MEKPVLNHFYNYEEICAYLKSALTHHCDVMTLDSLAKTDEGRDIWGITLCRDGNPDEKPALYVQGGVHAKEGMGITCCLNFLWTVLEQKSDILDQLTVYILPCTNPDGSDLCVKTGLALRSKLELIPGLSNAVIPQDLDGDGKILFMRWEDPAGYYVDLPECGNMLVPRRPGDRGPFYNMITEGIVANYDGGSLQLGYRALDFNRQYGFSWKNNANAGDFPGNHIEPRTIMKFLSTHPNIFMIMDVHCGTRALMYGTPNNVADARFLEKLAYMCQDIADIEPVTTGNYARRDGDPATQLDGHIDDYAYHALGIPSLTVELGNGFNSLGMNAHQVFNAQHYERELVTQLAAMHKAKGRIIAYPWKKVNHPQLGEVEVGGRDYHNAYIMDPDDMLELLPKVAEYFLKVSEMVPVLDFTNITCEAMGADIYRIRVGIINNGQLNTRILYGATGYQAIRDNIQFKIEGAQEVLSSKGAEAVHSLDPLDMANAEWFICAKPGDQITVKAVFPKAVNAEKTVILS